MQIHELNNFTGTLGAGSYVAIDDGNDTGKVSTQQILANTEARIDNIIAGEAPSAAEVTDARYGADGVTYTSLGTAIRTQFTDVKSALTKSGVTTSVDISDADAGWIRTNGSLVTQEDWYHKTFSVKKGDTIRLYSAGYSTNVSMIGVFINDTYFNKVTSTDANYKWYEYTFDNDCTAYVSIYKTALSRLELVDNTVEHIQAIDKSLGVNYTIIPNKFVRYGYGTEASNNDYSVTDFINCEYVDYVVQTNCGNDVSGIAFYTNNKTYISGYNPYSDNGSEVLLSKPLGACYVRISCRNQYIDEFKIRYNHAILSLQNTLSERVITVGTGKDYTSLITALESITDSSAENRYIVELYEGTYNTIDTAQIDSSYKGLIVPDWVSIVGIGNRDSIVIKAECPDAYSSYAQYISTLNFRDNGRIENVTIEGKNVQYCNHDDYSSGSDLVIRHEYINCKFIMRARTSSSFAVAGACVGIGAMYDKQILFDRCDFINEASHAGNSVCILAHDSNGRNGMSMIVDSCKLSGGTGRHNMHISSALGLLENYIVLKGNRFDEDIYIENRNSSPNLFKFKAWGNKGFRYVLGGTLTDISDDVDAYANEA